MPPKPPAPGWVYILTNPAMPKMVKIGLTTRTPKERAAELSSATGVPLPFVVAWARAVSDCDFVEKAVHRMLADKRVNKSRDSFRVDVKTACQVIEAAAGGKLGDRWRPSRKGWLRRLTGWLRCRRRSARYGKGRGGRGRRRRGDLTGFMLLASAVALIIVLILVKPTLPDWLPQRVWQAFSHVEALGE
jgi:hypothetical protein